MKYYNGRFDAYQRTYIIESTNKNQLSVPFLYRFLEQYVTILQKQAIGGVIKYIKLGMLTDAEIILPNIALQNKLVTFIQQSDKSKFAALTVSNLNLSHCLVIQPPIL